MRNSNPAFLFQPYIDGANLVTLGNVMLGVLGIGAAVANRFEIGAYLLFAATLVDHADGYLARRYYSANRSRRAFGKQLDTLADLTNFAIAPALALMLLGSAAPLYVAAAGLLVLTAVLRLSHFTITSETNEGVYIGLPTTYGGFLLANAFLLHLSGIAGLPVLLVAFLGVGVLQVTNMRIAKRPAATNMATMSIVFIINALVCFSMR